MKKKVVIDAEVGIIFSIIGIIASIFVIVMNFIKNESIGVGIGLLLFCTLSLITNVKNKIKEKP